MKVVLEFNYPDDEDNLKRFVQSVGGRGWVDLTDEEIDQGLCQTNYALKTAGAWHDGVEWARQQLKERNT